MDAFRGIGVDEEEPGGRQAEIQRMGHPISPHSALKASIRVPL